MKSYLHAHAVHDLSCKSIPNTLNQTSSETLNFEDSCFYFLTVDSMLRSASEGVEISFRWELWDELELGGILFSLFAF